MKVSRKITDRLARKRRIRARIRGTSECPRLTVYRSLTQITAQVIDDGAGRTIASVSSRQAKAGKNIEAAKKVGEMIAAKAKEAGVSAVIFDRNAYRYHGRVKALADAAREGGLQF